MAKSRYKWKKTSIKIPKGYFLKDFGDVVPRRGLKGKIIVSALFTKIKKLKGVPSPRRKGKR